MDGLIVLVLAGFVLYKLVFKGSIWDPFEKDGMTNHEKGEQDNEK